MTGDADRNNNDHRPDAVRRRTVETVRSEHDWSAQLGVPAHVTLLGRFLKPRDLDESVVRRLTELFREHRGFETSFDRLVCVDDVACLLPDDPRPFDRVHESLRHQWPQFERRSLHQITLARDLTRQQFERLLADLQPLLPLSGSVRRAMLLAADGNGSARVLESFDFG